jgi:hypothetical protein
MRKPFFMALAGLALVGCGSADDGGPSGPDAAPPINPCQLLSDPENTPGAPFDYQAFKNDILPQLQTTCGTAGCHGAPSANRLTVFTAGSCPDAETFNSMVPLVDYRVNVDNSILLKNLDGTDAHPIPYAGSPILTAVTAFLEDAFNRANGDGEPDITNFFNENDYATQIQPALDAAGCIVAGCHDKATATKGFGLHANPAVGSPEMAENFGDVVTYVALNATLASDTTLYDRSTDNHAQKVLNAQGVAALEAWIKAALDEFDDDGNISTCAPEAKFNVGVFDDEIMPLLEGAVDYNDIDSGRTSTGCARSECHGRNRGPGTFYLDPGRTPEENIDSFRCFIDLTNPSASQVLICPLNLSGCQKKPHPGGDIFFGVDDLNYQKLLGFIYATENGATPLDFAFFVRKINPLFNDENAVQDGLLGLTCASAGCHNAPNGRDPDNGSNFGIIAEATDQQDLFLNYISAANFTLFNDATQSSLFLYPTNEIANQNNPLATGFDHPGGECFAVNDPEALDILKFSGGIRPNAQGFLQDFLVAGLFPATDVTDDAPFDEDALKPKIFERSGQSGQFNQGQWDLFSSVNENIDFLQAFVVADAEETFAIAIAYVINTTTRELDTVITVQSENDIVLRVGADPDVVQEAIGRDGVGATITTRLPAFGTTKTTTRIMVKAFQKVGDVGLDFTMQFADDNGNILTDATKELVFTLSPDNGGI